MDLKDRFTRGCLIGLIGGIATTVLGYVFFLVKFGTLRFSDFAAILIYGRKAHGLLEILFATMVHWGFSAAAGIVFIYLLKVIGTKNLILKGWFFGVTIWFVAYITTELFKIQEFATISFASAVANFLVSSLYGIITAKAYSYLEEKLGRVSNL